MKIVLHLARTTRFLLTAGLLLTALGLTAARYWLLPEVDAYRQSLQARLSENLGQSLRIGGLSAHMRGFYPELVLRDVAVVDPASGAINVWLGQMHVGLDLPNSLSSGEWRTGWIALQGADLTLRRRADGEVVLDGVRSLEGLPPWLFGYGRFELQGGRLRWHDEIAGASLEFANADLLIINDGSHHRLAADVSPAGAGRLRWVAELDGDMERPAQLAGRVYLHGQGLRPETWPLPALDGFTLRSGVADFRLWADWRNGGLQALAGWVSLAQPVLAYGSAAASLAGLDGWFRWRRADAGWTLETVRLRPNLDGAPWPESRISVAYESATLRAAADYVRLDDAASLLRVLAPALPAEGWATLDSLGLRGELRDLTLVYAAAADNGQPHYGLCANLKGFGMKAHEALPGITGLSGSLCGDERAAQADVAAGPGAVDLPHWFRAPLEYKRAEGRLLWRLDGGGWSMSSEGLRLETPKAALTSRFRLAMDQGAESPLLDWRARLERGDMDGISRYLPAHIMPAETVAWLDAAFLGGRILGGEARLRGPLAAFPFLAGDGLFQVRADVADARLRFAEGWLPLTGLSAQVSIDGDGLEVRNGQGMLGETVAADVSVRIDHMAPEGRLRLSGRMQGGLPQVLDYFAKTPRAALIARLKDDAEMDGRAAVDLLLGYAFSDDSGTVDVKGEARVADGRLKLAAGDLQLDALHGAVRFNGSRVQADDLRATLLGAPVSLTLSGDGADLRVGVSGHTTVQKLRAWQPGEAWDRISGKLGYKAELILPQDFKNAGQGLSLALSGDLAGVAVDLPPPFGKAVDEPGSVRLEAGWDEKGGIGLRADYLGLARLQTRLGRAADGRWGAEAGELALGDAPLGAPPTAGWRISGRLAAIPLDAWWERLSGSPAALAYGGKIRQVELAVASPNWEGREWGELSLSLSRVADGWDGYVESAVATGALRFPSSWPSDRPVALDLERLALPKMPKETLDRARQAQIDPAQLPVLTVHSRHVSWQGHDLGQLDCEVERRPAGLRLKQCAIASDLQKTSLEGEWWRANAKDFSRLDGKMKIKDLGRLLEQLGLGDEVADTPAKLTFALQWQDAPQRVAASKLNGNLSVNLGEGALRHVDPGVGRALGLFNIETLKRRLLLDFSDVFDEGLAFDKVRGGFKITDGNAETRNLLIDGPSARVFISGKTDLAERTLDQLVTVVPRTSLAWPILGTLAGGPAVGAAVLLAQQLVGDRLEGITASQYSVKGSWDDPAVVLLSRNTPLEVLQRAWQGMKDISELAEPEENNE